MTPKSPLSDTAIRTAIVSGAIVPPPGERRPAVNVFAIIGWVMAVLGTAAMAVAYLMH